MIRNNKIVPSLTEIEINRGVKKSEFSEKIDKITSKKEMTRADFKELAKDVVGGKESLANFLKTNNILPRQDVDRLNTFHFFSKAGSVKANLSESKAFEKLSSKLDTNGAYGRKLDTQSSELKTRKTELESEIPKATEKLIILKKGTPEYGEQLGLVHSLKQELKGVEEKISKIPEQKKSGITKESIAEHQASKSGENLYQKIMSTKVYEKDDITGKPKVSTMLKGDMFGLKTKVIDSMAPKAHGPEAAEGHHDTYGWSNVKDKFVPKKVEMLENIGYRKAYVDQLMKESKESLQVQGGMRAVGSTNLTSDYDATILGLESTKPEDKDPVTGKQKKASPVVQAELVAKFNKEFRDDFKVESGTAFDTNIYVDDFDLSDKNITNAKLPADLQAKDDNNQDALALVKQRIHLGDGWNKYTESVVKGLPEGKREEMTAKFAQADKYAGEREDEINKEIITINKPDIVIANLSKEQIKEHAEAIKHAAGPKAGDVEAQALNRLYEKKLVIVKTEEAKGDLPGADKQKIDVSVKKLKGEALFFANEPYFSEGGVRHIVGNLQKMSKKPFDEKFEITKAQGLQSISENIGDTMKEFNHFSKEGLGTVAYKSSKYVNRLADAIAITTGEPKGEGDKKAMVIPANIKITLGGKEYPLKDVVADLRKSNVALLDIRGEKIKLDDAAKGPAAEKMLKDNTTLAPFKAVKTPEQYKQLLLDITSQVNIKARQ
jgi:hypothetical protein